MLLSARNLKLSTIIARGGSIGEIDDIYFDFTLFSRTHAGSPKTPISSTLNLLAHTLF